MRPIDVDELEKVLIPEDASGGFWGYGTLKVILDRQPTVDAVRHGIWIKKAGGKQCDCSVCGTWFDNTCNYDIRKDWNYCPNCGAKMDGESEYGLYL
jgi:hypothetical protein